MGSAQNAFMSVPRSTLALHCDLLETPLSFSPIATIGAPLFLLASLLIAMHHETTFRGSTHNNLKTEAQILYDSSIERIPSAVHDDVLN